MSGYGKSLVAGFSKQVKRIMCHEKYQALFPDILPGHGTNSATEWQVEGSTGHVTAAGLGGSLTGKGGKLLILDDYCKNREEARSQVYLQKTWDSFRNDFMTRREDPSITIIVATPWAPDDVRGKIRQAMKDDPLFPRFEELSFPAQKPGPGGWEYLFPEHFTPQWYNGQRAILGRQASALLDCEPIFEGGSRFDTRKVIIHQTLEGWPKLREGRGWDLASSSKDRDGSDPDWTFGSRGCIQVDRTPYGKKYHLWLSSIVACREEAPKRDALCRATAKADTGAVTQYVEAFGAYKDAYTQLRSVLNGISVVKPSRLPGDKSAKLAALEPIFDSCQIHVYGPGCEASVLKEWMNQFSEFPDGKHDDGPDSTAVLYHALASHTGTLML